MKCNQGWRFIYFWGCTCNPNFEKCNPNACECNPNLAEDPALFDAGLALILEANARLEGPLSA